jgi:hypothetical protein
MRKFISCVSAIAVIAATSTPAFAAVTVLGTAIPEAADGATLAAMESQCAALAAAHDTGNGDIWSAEVVEGAVTPVSGPTLNASPNYDIDEGSVQGFDFHPSETKIDGDPKRNGGSPNMFGVQIATAGYYGYSTYNFTADYDSVFAHAFSCDISKEKYNAPVLIPGHPVEGFYTNPGTDPSEGEGSCQGVNNTNPHWGTSFGACVWNETGPATDDEYTEESWDPAVFVVNEPGIAVNQTQTDTLDSFEDHGASVELTGERVLGTVVVCISPSSTGKKLPGEWRQQNGYTGDKCTTAWYNGGATVGVPNLNTGSNNGVTIPVL